MASLLDFMNSDDARLGIGLLAAAGPQTDPTKTGIGYALQAAMADVDARKKAALQNQYLQSQISDTASQAALRQQQAAMAVRKMNMQAWAMGLTPDGTPAAPDATAAPSAPVGGLLNTDAGGGAAGGGGGGAPAGGGVASASSGTPAALTPTPDTPVNTPRGPMTYAQISAAYKIPFAALVYDTINNDGKGIGDMIMKRGAPDIQFTNGVAIDKNDPALRSGTVLPFVNTSSSGQTTQGKIGPNGELIVSAPQGALKTAYDYAHAGNVSRAQTTPGTPYIGTDNRMYPQSQADQIGLDGAGGTGPTPAPVLRPTVARSSVGGGAMPEPQPGMTGTFLPGADGKVDVQRAMAAINGMPNGQDKANAWAGLKAQIAKEDAAGAPPPAATSMAATAAQPVIGPRAVEFSPREKAEAAGETARQNALGTGAGTAVVNSAVAAQGAQSALRNIQNVRDALKAGDVITGTGANARVDMSRLASTMGWSGKDNDATLSNTRAAITGLASMELDSSKALANQGQVSDAERKLLQRAASGEINFSAPELNSLLDTIEKSANYRISQNQQFTKMQREGASSVDILDSSRNAVQPNEVQKAAATPGPKTFQALPPAVQFKGRVATDSDTGKKYKSDGLIWKPVQ